LTGKILQAGSRQPRPSSRTSVSESAPGLSQGGSQSATAAATVFATVQGPEETRLQRPAVQAVSFVESISRISHENVSSLSTPPYFPEGLLLIERQKWDEFERRHFGPRGERARNPRQLEQVPTSNVRDFVLWVEENVPFLRRRIASLQKPEYTLKSLRVFVGAERLSHFMDCTMERLDPMVIKVKSYGIDHWQETATKLDTDEVGCRDLTFPY